VPEAQAAAWLMTPDAIREQCNAMLARAERDALLHFTLDLSRLDEAADYVAAVTRANYPDLAIPYHARWRHFEAGGIDRWRALQERLHGWDATELARIRIDLCTVSVLLDAGAGPAWTFREPDTGQTHARSEGLAIASLHAFASGLFSGDPAHPLRADAEGLSRLSDAAFAKFFQVAPGNPMVGVAGRLALLRNLGMTLRRRPELFGAEARIGGLLDHWRPRVAARTILATLLEALAAIWPGRQADMWPHPVAGMVPFHKLSQWLTYSMVEVLEQASITVDGLDDLTGLAEYRNGGLFLDIGVLRLREPSSVPLLVDHPAIVEWRALTVALLDRLTPLLRDRLGLSPAELPLARVLQGGTWDAGRKIARERRGDGGPPIVVQSDGTVF
jgi:Protein of unknown function (DUF1688)